MPTAMKILKWTSFQEGTLTSLSSWVKSFITYKTGNTTKFACFHWSGYEHLLICAVLCYKCKIMYSLIFAPHDGVIAGWWQPGSRAHSLEWPLDWQPAPACAVERLCEKGWLCFQQSRALNDAIGTQQHRIVWMNAFVEVFNLRMTCGEEFYYTCNNILCTDIKLKSINKLDSVLF